MLRHLGKALPVVILTARDAVADRVRGPDSGADDYLVKPFDLSELLAHVRALARRAADAPKSPILNVADLELDTRTRRVKRGGKTVELTAKEYAILKCLVRESNRVLTRTQIVTFPVQITHYFGSQSTFWAKISAMSVLGTLPIFFAVATLQRFLVRGISMGAVKG